MAELKLYNTLTRQKDPFTPLDPSNIRMYVCGPTVYDFAHIGNARPVIVFDVLFRLLRHLYGEAHVTYARNITDVDDKINDRAVRDYPGLPLNEAIRRVTEGTNAQYQADVLALGCLEPTSQPRATEHLDEMRAIIERLVAKGFAYVAEEHVLFSPEAMNNAKNKLPRYGALANRSLDEMIAGARVDVAPYKREATDFVLWKPSEPGQPGWPSPCGIKSDGRPGWHIECSAMSMAKLLEPFGGGLTCDDPMKNTFDIHGGGIDLVFPHHENEIAQSCCAFGSPRMANIWMHNGFLQVEGQKMSKSLGNFVTIDDLLSTEKFGGRPWQGQLLRFVMLQTHYHQPIDWTVDALTQARKELAGFGFSANRRLDVERVESRIAAGEKLNPDTGVLEALMDDLNTPLAITRLRALAKAANNDDASRVSFIVTLKFLGLYQAASDAFSMGGPLMDSFAPPEILDWDEFERLKVFVANNSSKAIEGIKADILRRGAVVKIDGRDLSIQYEMVDKQKEAELADQINSLITARLAAREAKNFAESDLIRDKLVAMGIQIMDSKDYVSGKLQTTWEIKR